MILIINILYNIYYIYTYLYYLNINICIIYIIIYCNKLILFVN